MQPAAIQFLRKAALLAVLFYLVTAFGSLVFDWAIDWRAYRNPRERLLWDSSTDQAEVVMLGDSVFMSAYVNSATDSLGNVLKSRTGKRVFNGALNGADSADFLNGARLLVKNGTQNATVFLDVVPTRFLQRRHPELTAGNYPGQFSRLIGDNLLSRGLVALRKPLLILDLDIMVEGVLHKNWYRVEDRRDRVWNKDGDLARKRFDFFEREQIDSDALRDFDWLQEMDSTLKESTDKLVVFITPVNHLLIKEYAAKENAKRYEARISRSREALLNYLQQNNISYIDGDGRFDSDSFVDLIHINARGDRCVADLVAGYLASHRQEIAGVNGSAAWKSP